MPDAVRSREDFELMIDGYDAEIAFTDHHIQQVLDALEEKGVLEDTAVIVTADHGDNFGEHGIYSDHVCADEAIHHVPLVVRWPGVTPEGCRCHAMLYQLDLGPTLIEMAGAEVPAHYDGVSFAEALRGGEAPSRDFLVWGHGLYTLQRAVRTRDHLFIRTYDDHGYRFDRAALYDVNEDPYQTTNLVDREAQTAAEMDHLLSEWLHEQSEKPYAIPDPMQVVLRERRKREAR